MTPKNLSECCNSEVRVAHGCDADFGHGGKKCNCGEKGGVTCWYECAKCGKSCDIAPPQSSSKPLPCPHGRLPIGESDGWKHCPHCLGLNNPVILPSVTTTSSAPPQETGEREVTIEGVGTFTTSTLFDGLAKVLDECHYEFRTDIEIEKLKSFLREKIAEAKKRGYENGISKNGEDVRRLILEVNQTRAQALREVEDEVRKIDWKNGGLGNTPYDNQIIEYYEKSLDVLLSKLQKK